jgi:acetyl esterase/lipase
MSPRAEEFSRFCLEASARSRDRWRCIADVVTGPDAWQRLDVYLPESTPVAGCPVLVTIHGGFWSHGYKEWHGFLADSFCDLPAIVVSVGYRLSTAAHHPAALDDCLAAIEWVYRNIAEHGGDPQRIFVSGHSAGGHLAALVALQPEVLEARGIPPSVIRGCLPVSAIFDTVDPALPADRVDEFLGPAASKESVSPIHLVRGTSVPFLIAYGEKDMPLLIPQAKAMAAALRAAGSDVETIVIPGADHFDVVMDALSHHHPWTAATRTMLVDAR